MSVLAILIALALGSLPAGVVPAGSDVGATVSSDYGAAGGPG